MGDPVPPPKKEGAEPPNFRSMFIVDKTAGWIKMALGIFVGLSPSDFVLDVDPAPSQNGGGAPVPNFRPISTVAKRLDRSRCHLVRR